MRSVAWGIVVGIEKQTRGGKVVFVLGRGGILFFYAHLSTWAPRLHLGQIVGEGALIGWVGDTGNARGIPHLHFEVRPVVTLFAPVDPLLLVGARRSLPSERVKAAIFSLGEPR